MNNKNIIFKRTLKEYNKRYRHHKNLLKFTKKEVEEFDKTANTVGQLKLLDHNNWWFIDGTYYQAPRVLRPYWFRNLNAGAQTAICLLGAGVIATAVTVPLVLMNQNKVEEPSITIQGADFDKSASHIELHKESTIVLKEKSGKTITDVTEVKVGGKVITRDTDWTYDKTNKKVTIKAEAMTSTEIEIKVNTEDPHIVDLETWIEKANKLNADFLSSTLEYTLDQVTKYVEEGEEKTLASVGYINDPDEGRQFWVYFEGGNGTAVGTYRYSGNQLFDNGCITDKGVCEIYDDEIVYKNENAGDYEYKELHINKFGYPTYELFGNGDLYEIEFNSEPKTPAYVVTKAQWIAKANELVLTGDEALCNSKLEYKQSQLTYKVNGDVKEITNFDYTGNGEDRKLTGRVDGEDYEFASCHYSGTYLDETLHELSDDGVYEIHDDKIVYKNENAGEQSYKELHINKYGYPIYELSGGGDLYETIWEGIPEIYYNIDWATSSFELVSEQSRTLHGYATEATKIEFEKKDDTSGVCVGEDSGEGQEPVYASFKTVDEEKILEVWSAGKIRFTDNDVPSGSFSGIFSGSSAGTISLGNVDTSKLTNMSYMFAFTPLSSLDVSNLDTSSAINMSAMFYDMYSTSPLAEIKGLNKFNTSNVTDMSAMFSGQKNISTLDLSCFDTRNVTDMSYMFADYNGSTLKTIYVGDDFSTDLLTSETGANMFNGCTNLIGGKGTVFDSEHVTYEYARIDNPVDGNPGYFTDAKEIPTSDSWFNFTKIEEDTAYSVRLADSGLGQIPSNFVIPSTHKETEEEDALPVTQIESNAFSRSIENPVSLLVIPSSITSIGKNSFDSTFIDENTDIRFKDTTHTWTIKNINETTIETDFDPSKEESKVSVVAYLTADYTWSKNKSEKEIFLEKYQTALNKFYESEDEYTAEQITINGYSCSEINYGTEHKFCYVKDYGGGKEFLAGTKTSGTPKSTILSVETIKSKIEEYEKQSGYTFEYADDVPSVIIKDANDNVVYEATFNNDGYVTKYKDSNTEYTVQYN